MYLCRLISLSFFYFYDTTPSEFYTLSLHDALPISLPGSSCFGACRHGRRPGSSCAWRVPRARRTRSEEHTSELQSLRHIVCRLLLEKKKNYLDIEPTR